MASVYSKVLDIAFASGTEPKCETYRLPEDLVRRKFRYEYSCNDLPRRILFGRRLRIRTHNSRLTTDAKNARLSAFFSTA